MQAAAQTARANPPRSQLLGNLLLILGSILFFWVVIELPAALNIFDYQGLEYNQVWGNLRFIRVPDPELLHIEPPHAHYVGSSRGGDFEMRYTVPPPEQTVYHWDLRYDAHGFRNSRDLDRADIAVIGDSMVEGMTVGEDRIATSLLARSTGQTVANLGQYGFGPQQEFAVLRRYGLSLRPKLFIWMFFEGNDIQDEIEYRAIRMNPPAAWNHFIQRSFTRFALRSVSRLARGPRPDGAIRSCRLPGANGGARPMYFTFDSHPVSAAENQSIHRIAALIAGARRMSSAQQTAFLFVFVPDKFRVLHDQCVFPVESESRRWSTNDLPSRLHDGLEAASPGIRWLDLTPALRAAAAGGAIPYYSDDIHFSDFGHAAAAKAIGDYLSSGVFAGGRQ